jgi:hypothetical protein
MYGLTRGIATVLAAAVAGFLLWIAAAWVDGAGTGPYWARMGLVAAAGLVMALAQLVGGWTKGRRPTLAPGMLLVAFLPVLICAGWVLAFSAPNSAWAQHHVSAWSGDIGIRDVVQNFRMFAGVLAFGIGLVFGFCFDTPVSRALPPQPVEETATAHRPVEETVPAERPEDEPIAAERRAAPADDRELEREPEGEPAGHWW